MRRFSGLGALIYTLKFQIAVLFTAILYDRRYQYGDCFGGRIK